MATFFELIFPELNPMKEENQVCCPFPHYTNDGTEYFESRPSAGINLSKKVFHCLSCNRGLSELKFIQEYMGISEDCAKILRNTLEDVDKDVDYWESLLAFKNQEAIEYVKKDLGISEKIINQLKLKLGGKSGYEIDFPLFLFGKLVDVANYEVGRQPKTIRWKQSISGLISPYDIWRYDTEHPTLICAGEKDMAIARTKGFNAITISGGEGSIPRFFGNDFKNREIYIIYDNDDAGHNGAKKVADYILQFTNKVKVIDISSVCIEKGQDIWDFFMTYKKTPKDLVKIINETHYYIKQNESSECPTLHSLIESTKAKYFNKLVKCNIQVVATLDAQYALPIDITGTKKEYVGDPVSNTMVVGDTKQWQLSHKNLKDALYLIGNKLSEKKIHENMKDILLRIPTKENGISVKINKEETVYRCTVTDFFETMDDSIQVIEQEAYCIGVQLESGKK